MHTVYIEAALIHLVSMSQPPKKRRHVEITNAQKQEVCLYKRANDKATQQNILDHFSAKWGFKIGRSTVSDILKKKDHWLSTTAEVADQTRAKCPKQQSLEKALFLWFSDVRSKGATLSDDILIEKAREFGLKLAISDFNYSRGWLQRFKKRHHIKSYKCHGESASADLGAVSTGREQLKIDLANYDPNDIYNIDETGLFYKLKPSATLATGGVKGEKRSKERITVALCCNATGTDKIRPLVIGRAARPRCFGRDFEPSMYVDYKYNKKAWMTAILWDEAVKSLNTRARGQGRHYLLLCDNASSHKNDQHFSNLTLKYLPPNTTSHLQPLDGGIIASFKAQYRKKLVRHFLRRIEDDQPVTTDMRLAIQMIRASWDAVTPMCITRVWYHVDILPATQSSDDQTEIEDEDDLPLSELQSLLRALPVPEGESQLTAEEYTAADSATETDLPLDDDTIVELVSIQTKQCDPPVESDPELESADEEPARQPTSLKEARQGLLCAVSFFEEKGELGSVELVMKLLSEMEDLSRKTARQLSIADFFTRKQ